MKRRTYLVLVIILSHIISLFAEDPVKVLIVEGLSNHDWRHRVDILRHILAKDSDIEVEVSISPSTAGDPAWADWRPQFSRYDVVISGFNDIQISSGLRWPAEVEADFEEFVALGGGFMGFHEANNAFDDWDAYNEIIGLGWRGSNQGKAIVVNQNETITELAAGDGPGTGHGPRIDTIVTRHADNHPIYAGLPDAWMAADVEVYRYARGPAKNLTVLTYATDQSTGLQFPLEWSTTYGLGRTYFGTYGHVWSNQAEPIGMRCAAFQTIIIRAVKWLAGRNPGTNVPADFPGTNATSLRPHGEDNAGLDTAPPAVPFNGGVLPTEANPPPAVDVVEAFPSIAWKSPIVAQPWPESSGNSTHLLIAEMDGRLFRVQDNDNATTPELVLDIQGHCWEQNWSVGQDTSKHGGLQNVVFHPRFAKGEAKDFIYVHYLHAPSDDPDSTEPYYVRIARFTWNSSSGMFENELIMIQQYDTTKGHDGSGMAFGDDGFLYISVGDEGTQSGAATPHSQITDRFRSGIWRIDVDQQGGSISHPIRKSLPALKHNSSGDYLSNTTSGNINTGYYIPSDNPWVDEDGQNIQHMEEFYAVGLRQPHRMTFDSETGWLWIGDVGGGSREEISICDAPGLNFQWNFKEGTNDGFRARPSPLLGSEKAPFLDYGRSFGTCVIGGYVYRGSGIPGIRDHYLFGDNGTQRVYAVPFDPNSQTAGEPIELAQPGGPSSIFKGISSFGTDTSGELLVMRMGQGQLGNGKIYRLKPSSTVEDKSQFPSTLSATNLFSDLQSLTPIPALIPYEVNMPLWTDNMNKYRWMMIPSDGNPDTPSEQITYSANGTWRFPEGSVLVKHFERPDNLKPIETRLMVRSGSGDWAFTTYKWREDGSDADLFEDGETFQMVVGSDIFDYQIPSRRDCASCHASASGPTLGPRTRQLNSSMIYPATGRRSNQIETLSKVGYIAADLDQVDLRNAVTLPKRDDPYISAEEFSRAYIDSNCMHCHQPNANRAAFDARFSTPLSQQELLCGPVLIDDMGLVDPRIVKPGDVENSILFQRMNTAHSPYKMPPLGKGLVDEEAIAHIANWILSMDLSDCSVTTSASNPPAQNLVVNGDLEGSLSDWNLSGSAATSNIAQSGAQGVIMDAPGSQIYQNVAIEVGIEYDISVWINASQMTSGIAVFDTNDEYDDNAQFVIYDANSGWTEYSGTFTATDTDVRVRMFTGGTFAGTVYFDNVRITPVGAPVSTVVNLGNTIVNGSTDTWAENMVINETDTYTNSDTLTQEITMDQFSFYAGVVTDPITPFVVRVEGDNFFTVLAVGDGVAHYSVGANSFNFSSSNKKVLLEPGETLAIGFIDSSVNPSPNGGSGNGAVTFTNGGDEIHYSGGNTNGDNGNVVEGLPPVYGKSVSTSLTRDYHFHISMNVNSLVVNADTDDDGLDDSWEKYYTSDLNLLSPNADSDADGFPDDEERMMGTNPLDNNSKLKSVSVIMDDPNGDMTSATIETKPGRRYKLWLSTDLVNWTDMGSVEAAGYPATETSVQIDSSSLPPERSERIFLRTSFVAP